MDSRLKAAKIFNKAIETPIAINEDGYIGINPSAEGAVIFNINDVTEYKIVVDEKPKNIAANVGKGMIIGKLWGGLLNDLSSAGSSGPSRGNNDIFGALAGGLLGGSKATNQINSISLVFKIEDFNNPWISVPLFTKSTVSMWNMLEIWGGMNPKDLKRYEEAQLEIQKLLATLDFLWNRRGTKLLP
jgi:hypothetical protein